jgi:hypothetical protein
VNSTDESGISNDVSVLSADLGSVGLPLTGSYSEDGGGLSPISVAHTKVLDLNTGTNTIVYAVSGAQTTDVKAYLDTMVYLVPSDDIPADIAADTSVQAGLYLDANSNIVVFAGGDTTSDTNRFVTTDQTVLPETWVRLTILMDYATDEVTFGETDQCFFKVMVNGSDLTSSGAYASIPTDGSTPTQVAGGVYLRAANPGDADVAKMNSVSLEGTGMIDDFVVTTQTPDFLAPPGPQYASDGMTPLSWVTAGGYTDAGNADSDAYTLYEEYLMGSDPDVSNSWEIETIAIDGSGILTLTWSGVETDADAVTVQGAATVGGTYSPIAGTIGFAGGTYTFTSDATVAGLGAFKLVASDE